MRRCFGYPASCHHGPLLDDVFWNVCPTSGRRGLAGWLVLCACVLHVPSDRALPLDRPIVSLCSIFFVSCRVGVGLWHDLLPSRLLAEWRVLEWLSSFSMMWSGRLVCYVYM